MGMDSKVSIILPTYNGGKYIRQTIDSVIAQNFCGWELLVIDDGSIDNTENIINEYINKDKRIIHFKNEVNLGIQKTLNKGLGGAEGEYIARIDDDDQWIDKDKLKRQVEFLNDNPEYVLVGTGAIVTNEKGQELFRYLLPEKDQDIRNKILMKNCFTHSSVLFRKESVVKLGGYTEEGNVKHLEDYDLWLKLGTIGKLANLPVWGINFMIRDDSLSSMNKLDQFKRNVILIKKYKNNYPNYLYSVIFCRLRLSFYQILNILPMQLKNKIIKIYKEF